MDGGVLGTKQGNLIATDRRILSRHVISFFRGIRFHLRRVNLVGGTDGNHIEILMSLTTNHLGKLLVGVSGEANRIVDIEVFGILLAKEHVVSFFWCILVTDGDRNDRYVFRRKVGIACQLREGIHGLLIHGFRVIQRVGDTLLIKTRHHVLKLRGIPCDGLSILLGKGKESVSLFVRVGGGIGTILAAYLRIVGGFLGSTKGHDHLLTRGLLLSHCFCGFGSVPLLLIMALPPVESTFPATSEPQVVLRLPCDEV